jgi:hypothetical protein
MSDIFFLGIGIFAVLLPIALCIFLYLLLARKVLANELSSLFACILLAIPMLIIPWFVLFFLAILVEFFYKQFPSLLPASSDVLLPMGIALLFNLSYLVSIISILITCTKLFCIKVNS